MKKGWAIKTLGEILQKTETINPLQSPEVEFEYIDVSSVSNSTFQIEETQTLKGKDAPNRARRRVKANDVLFATIRPTLCRIAVVPEYLDKQVCSTGYFVLRPNAEINYRFLFYWLFTEDFLGAMEQLQKGASYPAVTDADVRAQKILFPPLLEQRRIVGILDKAFDAIAIAKANAEKNLRNVRALFESHLNEVFTKRGEGWVEKRLDDVCGFQNGFAFKSSTFKETGSPILRISNIQDGKVDTEKLVFFDPKDYNENLDRYRIMDDDLLIAMSGATTGKLGFNTESTVFYLNQRVGKFEPGKSLNKRFLFYYLSTKVEENLHISAGAAQPNLSTEQIKCFVLPLPSIEKQSMVVAVLESLATETQRLESIYQRKLVALDELKKSLLHQAFSGEL